MRALFTLASKIAPCTIFIDEVDSMLGRRDSRHEAEAMRKIKNEVTPVKISGKKMKRIYTRSYKR